MASAQEVFLFSPTSVPGCQLWLDAADTSIISVTGTTLNSWTDKASSIVFVPTGGTGITYSNGLINLASNTFLKNNSSSISISQTFTIFLIASNTTGGQAGAIYISPSGNGQPGIYVEWPTPTQYRLLYRIPPGSGGGVNVFISAPGILPLTMGTMYRNASGANYELGMGINGSSPTTTSDTQSSPLGICTELAFGVNFNATNQSRFLTGSYAEILVYGGTLPLSERQQVEGYLAWKWGLQGSLPSNHPFKTYRPLAQVPFPTQIPPMPIVTQTVSVFTPTQISGCQLWLDASDSSSVTLSGSSVTQWRDKSGNGLIMSQLNGSAMPTLNSNLLNTRNVIGFTTSQNMTSLSNLTLTPAQSIFVVFNSLTSTNYFFMEQGPNTNSTDGSFLYGGNLDLFGIRRTVPRYVFDSNAGRGVSPFVANTWYFCSFVNSNITATVNDVYLSIVGTQRAIGFNGGNNVLTGTATNLFYLNPSSRVPASNYYAEIIIYNSALTVPQVKQMEGYLAWKWGLIASLPNGHPYKSAPIAPFPSRSVPFNGSLSSWQPTQVPGCALWLDAADSSTLTISGTAVTQWNDKSGNGNTATAPTANVPVYSPRSLNTLATLQFRSSNDILLVANNFNIPSITFFIVVNPASSQPNGVNAGILSTDTASAFGRTLGLGSGSWQQERYNAFSNITGYTANVWTIVSLQFTTTVSSALGVNGTIFSAPASGTGTNSTGLKIGSYNNTGSYATFNANFDVGEILVFSDSVTINQRQQVEGYLAWKWGLQGSLPGNHPFKRWPPSP